MDRVIINIATLQLIKEASSCKDQETFWDGFLDVLEKRSSEENQMVDRAIYPHLEKIASAPGIVSRFIGSTAQKLGGSVRQAGSKQIPESQRVLSQRQQDLAHAQAGPATNYQRNWLGMRQKDEAGNFIMQPAQGPIRAATKRVEGSLFREGAKGRLKRHQNMEVQGRKLQQWGRKLQTNPSVAWQQARTAADNWMKEPFRQVQRAWNPQDGKRVWFPRMGMGETGRRMTANNQTSVLGAGLLAGWTPQVMIPTGAALGTAYVAQGLTGAGKPTQEIERHNQMKQYLQQHGYQF